MLLSPLHLFSLAQPNSAACDSAAYVHRYSYQYDHDKIATLHKTVALIWEIVKLPALRLCNHQCVYTFQVLQVTHYLPKITVFSIFFFIHAMLAI